MSLHTELKAFSEAPLLHHGLGEAPKYALAEREESSVTPLMSSWCGTNKEAVSSGNQLAAVTCMYLIGNKMT